MKSSNEKGISNIPHSSSFGGVCQHDRGCLREGRQDQDAQGTPAGRIAQGVKSGQLTPRETARLETREANLNKRIRDERAANGGHLTDKEKAQVNRQQNRISRDIRKQKHDGQTQ